MSDAASPNDPAPRRKWFLRSGLAVLAVAAVVLAVVFVNAWTELPQETTGETVASEWNATISRLGLEPVYPPQEDVVVGDIFLIVSADAGGGAPSQSLQGRALKIWHVDLSEELKKVYRSTYAFPDTLPKPAADGAVWEQKPADGSIFDVQAERRQLPVMLLPGFTVARVRQASASGGWLAKSLQALGAVESQSERTIELKIPQAETYGVPAIVGNAYLVQFCNDPRSRRVCTEKGARGFMSTLVGAKAFEQIADPKQPGKSIDRLSIEIVLVSRVYLTRSIEAVSNTGRNFGAEAKLAAQLNEAAKRVQAEAKETQKQNPNSDDVKALQRMLDEQKKLLDSLVAQAADAPGGAIGALSVDQNRVGVSQVLQRPVAIAFRGVRTRLINE